MTLKETLLEALGGLAGTRELHLHVVVTEARKERTLYRFARPRPVVEVREMLVLLSEETGTGARRFVVGLEAQLYIVRETESGILYISKVDTTGQGSRGGGATSTVVRAFIGYFVGGDTRPAGVSRLWVHVFARAQGQYLFPNSAEYEGKRVLRDVELCRWWKRVIGEVEERARGTAAVTRLYYVLPGFGEAEAVQVTGEGSGGWKYGHPYSQGDILLPCPVGDGLGHWIPSFEDDPKARFMEELGGTRKRKREGGTLGGVTADEFWERMSFRQECVAGAVTGFFALGIAWAGVAGQAVAGQVPVHVARRIVAGLTTKVEFSSVERSERATAIIEGTVRGLCGEEVHGEVRVENVEEETGAGAVAGTVRRLAARRKQ